MRVIQDNASASIQSVLAIVLALILGGLYFDKDFLIFSALVVGFGGLISSKISKMIHFLWQSLSLLLGYLIPNILLGTIFYFILTPLALMARTFSSKDELMLKNPTKTTFSTVSKKFDLNDFKYPW